MSLSSSSSVESMVFAVTVAESKLQLCLRESRAHILACCSGALGKEVLGSAFIPRKAQATNKNKCNVRFLGQD